MAKRAAPKKRKAASTITAAAASKTKKAKASTSAMFGKSKKKGSSSVSTAQEMFQSIAEDPSDTNSIVNMEGKESTSLTEFALRFKSSDS
jgi:hypothetical protein